VEFANFGSIMMLLPGWMRLLPCLQLAAPPRKTPPASVSGHTKGANGSGVTHAALSLHSKTALHLGHCFSHAFCDCHLLTAAVHQCMTTQVACVDTSLMSSRPVLNLKNLATANEKAIQALSHNGKLHAKHS
jgi:hypothetical protein